MQKAREEYANLKVLNKDAVVAKENAINEFAKFEDKVYRFVRVFGLLQTPSHPAPIEHAPVFFEENEKNVKFAWKQREKKLNIRNYKQNESTDVWSVCRHAWVALILLVLLIVFFDMMCAGSVDCCAIRRLEQRDD